MMEYRVALVMKIASILLTCCSKKEQQVEMLVPEYHIKNHVFIDSIKSEDLIDNFEYIALETTEDCLIGEVDDLQIADEKLYVVSQRRVLVFDFDGKFVFKIDQIGRGPGEYQRIDNISIDNGELFLYDNTQYRVLCYDSNNGSHLFTHTLDYSARHAIVRGGLAYADRGEIPNRYISNDDRLLIDRIGERGAIRSFFPQSNTIFQSNCYLDVYDNGIYWIDPLLNRVYKVDSVGVKSYLFFDFGADNVPTDLPKDTQLQELSDRNKKYIISEVCDNAYFVLLNIISGEELMYMRFNKELQVNHVFKNISVPLYQTTPTAQTVYKNKFYKVVPSWEVMFMKHNMANKKLQLNEDHRDYGIYKAVMERTESDNPLVARFDFKR